MKDKIVHIGFPKTGTTFLQREVFPLFRKVKFLGFNESAQLFKSLVYSDPLDVDLKKIRKNLESYSDTCLLVSYENLTGSPFLFRGMNRSSIPAQLKELGFNKVIITIRNQKDVIDSYYRQYVALGGTLRFKDFIDLEGKRTIQTRFFELNYLNYHDLIHLYRDIFGEENLFIITQEDIRDDLKEVSDHLALFIKKEKINPFNSAHNQSLSNLAIGFLRIINHFTYSHLSPYHLISSRISTGLLFRLTYKILDPYVFTIFSSRKSYVKKYKLEERLATYYQTSNNKLNKLTGISY